MKAQGARAARLDLQELLDLARGDGGTVAFGAFQALRSGRSEVAALRAFYRLRDWLHEHGVAIEKRTAEGRCTITLDVEAGARLLGSDKSESKSALHVRRRASQTVIRDEDVTLVSVKEAARLLDLPAKALRAGLARSRPLLPFVRLGEREKKIRLCDLKAFIESRLVGARTDGTRFR